jgi:hypothetical protein
VLTVTTTTRKFFTILASVVWFGHALSPIKWLAVGLVFAGLSIDVLGKYFDDYLARSSAGGKADHKKTTTTTIKAKANDKTKAKAKKVQ